MAQALLSSARCIYDIESPLSAMSNDGLAPDALAEAIREWVDAKAEPGIVMVDIGGGSCGIAARRATSHRKDVHVLGGVNLSMVLAYATGHESLDEEELLSKLLDRALNAVHLLEPDD